MSERQSATNLTRMEGRRERVDGKKDPATFAERLKLIYAPWGSLIAIAGAAIGVALAVTKPFTKKADAATVARDEEKSQSDHDILVGLKTEVEDMKTGQAWTQSVVLQLAEERGIQPAPIPTPHPIPVGSPR